MAKKKINKKDIKQEVGEEKPKVVVDNSEHAKANRMQSFYVRTVTTILMLVGFVLILFMGHLYCLGMVLFLMTL